MSLGRRVDSFDPQMWGSWPIIDQLLKEKILRKDVFHENIFLTGINGLKFLR